MQTFAHQRDADVRSHPNFITIHDTWKIDEPRRPGLMLGRPVGFSPTRFLNQTDPAIIFAIPSDPAVQVEAAEIASQAAQSDRI